jgi:hypothetical protein
MELSKHKNHRNATYLGWLRKQECVISGTKAQCAHHIRLGTNGGSSLKPSDYFCIPLLNEYHTTGLFAIHIIGEDSFLSQFRLNKEELFIGYLKQYLIEEFNTYVQLDEMKGETLLAYMINLIEEQGPRFDKPRKKTKSKSKTASNVKKLSVTEDEFYQKAKEEKRNRDRQLRMSLKEDKSSKVSSSLKGNEYYEKAKELKRIQDKELRKQMKSSTSKAKTIKTSAKKKKISATESDFYERAKELKRQNDKELRAKLKQSQNKKELSPAQVEYHQQTKELKRIRDKEFRQKMKEQRKNL